MFFLRIFIQYIQQLHPGVQCIDNRSLIMGMKENWTLFVESAKAKAESHEKYAQYWDNAHQNISLVWTIMLLREWKKSIFKNNLILPFNEKKNFSLPFFFIFRWKLYSYTKSFLEFERVPLASY